MTNQKTKQLTKEWQTKTLGKVCEKGSSNISLNKIKDNEGEYSIYGAKGFLKKVDFYHQDKPYISIIKDGAGVGRINLQKEKSSVIGTLQYLIPSNEVNINFLYYFLLGIDFKKYSCGAAIPHIYFKDYSKEEIPIPSLPTQKQIVKILDKTFESISKSKENAEKNLKNAKELFGSYLEEVFSNPKKDWEEKKLGEVCGVIAGQSPEGKYYNKNGEGLPFYQGKKEYGLKYLGKPNTWTTRITKEAEKGDILMSVRAPVGPINFSTQKICIGRGLAAIRGEKKIDREFLFYHLLKHEKSITGNTGAVFNSINKSQIENINLIVPSLSEQTLIVSKLDSLSKEIKELETIYKQKIKDLDELKKSMLQKAFSGELND
ncbi:MAG: restriction endonuclease subunit S [Nanoarchaeota archaeon]|nr:restriction endonuclease subunit S [Nanoarchaeota archaeon]